jgi:hypothetical protein
MGGEACCFIEVPAQRFSHGSWWRVVVMVLVGVLWPPGEMVVLLACPSQVDGMGSQFALSERFA